MYSLELKSKVLLIISFRVSFEMEAIGYALCWFIVSMTFYPFLPEVTCLAHKKEGILNDYQLIDKAAGLYSVFYSIGCIIAIFIGETLDRETVESEFMNEFGLTCDLLAIICIIYAGFFFVTNLKIREIKRIEKDPDPIFEQLNAAILRKMSAS